MGEMLTRSETASVADACHSRFAKGKAISKSAVKMKIARLRSCAIQKPMAFQQNSAQYFAMYAAVLVQAKPGSRLKKSMSLENPEICRPFKMKIARLRSCTIQKPLAFQQSSARYFAMYAAVLLWAKPGSRLKKSMRLENPGSDHHPIFTRSTAICGDNAGLDTTAENRGPSSVLEKK